MRARETERASRIGVALCVAAAMALAPLARAEPDDRAGLPLPAAEGAGAENARAAQLELDAEAAIRRNDLVTAEATLAESLALPENSHTARARELTGVVHEKTGDPVGARRMYREYLERYPKGADAERVAQRLAALDATQPAALRDSDLGGAREWRMDARGAFSQWYLHDHSRSDFDDALDDPDEIATDERVNVDELLSTADLTLAMSGPATRVELRASAAYVAEYRPVVLVGSDRQQGSYTMLYDRSLEVANENLGLSARFGRQPRFRDGIFGRFDGGLLSWQATPRFGLNLFGGHPVMSSRDLTTDDERTFRGSSLEFTSRSRALSASVHVLDQDALGEVDRRSVGGQVRVARGGALLDALIDYDRHFERVNAARLGLGYSFANSTLSLTGQRVHYPLLAVTNSIIGQPIPTIEAVRELFDRDALERLARDRTLESREATLTYSTHLTDHFQMVADATLARTSSSPGSAGVPAFGESGPDRFAGIQLIGTGFLREHAVWIAGLRSARYRLSDVHVLDLMSSFRMTPRFSIAPRLQFTDVDQSSDLGSARKLTPSLRFLYDVSRHAQIDANFGGNTIEQRYAGPAVIGRRREEAFIAYVGYRYLF